MSRTSIPPHLLSTTVRTIHTRHPPIKPAEPRRNSEDRARQTPATKRDYSRCNDRRIRETNPSAHSMEHIQQQHPETRTIRYQRDSEHARGYAHEATLLLQRSRQNEAEMRTETVTRTETQTRDEVATMPLREDRPIHKLALPNLHIPARQGASYVHRRVRHEARQCASSPGSNSVQPMTFVRGFFDQTAVVSRVLTLNPWQTFKSSTPKPSVLSTRIPTSASKPMSLKPMPAQSSSINRPSIRSTFATKHSFFMRTLSTTRTNKSCANHFDEMTISGQPAVVIDNTNLNALENELRKNDLRSLPSLLQPISFGRFFGRKIHTHGVQSNVFPKTLVSPKRTKSALNRKDRVPQIDRPFRIKGVKPTLLHVASRCEQVSNLADTQNARRCIGVMPRLYGLVIDASAFLWPRPS